MSEEKPSLAQTLAQAYDTLATESPRQANAVQAAYMLLSGRPDEKVVSLFEPFPPAMAADHTGMRVNYAGLLAQCQRGLVFERGLAEGLRQLAEHLKELGQRYYAGDATAVDEFLQLYCVEREARQKARGASQ